MKKSYLFLFVFILLFSCFGFAQQKGFGLGIIAGEPTGLSAKYFTSNGNAFDFGLGYSFTSSDNLLHLYIDYIFHNKSLIQSEENFTIYYGPGVRLKIRKENSRLGARGVIGINWLPKDAPFDVFFELAPVLDLIPETRLDLSGGVGARYFFN